MSPAIVRQPILAAAAFLGGRPALQKLLLLPGGDLGVAERTRASAPHW